MMNPIVAASLVNKAAVDCLEELRLPIETHREVVRIIAQWWGIGARAPELKVIEGGKDAGEDSSNSVR